MPRILRRSIVQIVRTSYWLPTGLVWFPACDAVRAMHDAGRVLLRGDPHAGDRRA